MKDIGRARRRMPRPIKCREVLAASAAAVTSESDIRASQSLLNDDTEEVPGDLVVPSSRAGGSLHSVVFPIEMDRDRLTISRFRNHDQLKVHIEEIQRIAQSKGGLQSLHDPTLRLMVSWLDLTAASYLNISPRSEIPKCLSLEIDPGNDTHCLEQLLARWDQECPDLSDIMSALRVTAAAASYVNRHINDPTLWRDGTAAIRILGPALHEILSLEGRPLPSDPGDKSYSARAAREAFRRAALVFIAAVRIRLGFEAHDMAGHLDAFRKIPQLPLVDWAVVPELNLWAHVVAAAREEPENRAWHVFTIVSIMQILGIETADRAFEVVRRVMWVDAISEGDCGLCREIDQAASGSFGRRIRDLQAVSGGVGLAGLEASTSTECTLD
ncbi:hypothetical protein DL766_007766 [Monosporascus sp. MC13-8B]|uniref:Transcription factor domain-containing protein n=1 Tax=Monosporascus cannonballus TaxID=155416 RepID=A0ABY0HK92_9PEZI|nr:hypothetical protein DL762_000020 [Monosporascus cannonballus]RYP00703.1 hypothetical protein DL763_000583 [Monosporascus cannonballus]RYP22208.1 hypothetical protein DL766_007766 [Monosporascus sp. MC13-8B]